MQFYHLRPCRARIEGLVKEEKRRRVLCGYPCIHLNSYPHQTTTTHVDYGGYMGKAYIGGRTQYVNERMHGRRARR